MRTTAVKSYQKPRGFTLIELMIAVGVLAIIGAIAVPAYIGYIRIARVDTMEYNMRSLRVMLEDERLETGSYGIGGATGLVSGVSDISDDYDWDPDSDLSDYAFTLNVTAAGDYDIWAVHTPSGTWRRCDNRMSNCCDGDDGSPAACP